MDISLLILVLLMFLVLKANRTIAVSSGPKRKEFALEFTNKTLIARLLRSPVAMDEMNCQLSCHANDVCDAYNFDAKTNQCELVDGRDDSVELKTKQDWKFRAQKCEANPCKNNTTCILYNDKPKCLCPCDWKGELCDVPIPNSDNVMSFPGGSVSDMVVLVNPFTSGLSQLSVSMWVHIDPTNEEHPLVSYATFASADAICVLSDKLQLRIGLNGIWSQFTESNQLIRDNNWHHFLFTWENVVGRLLLYIDGVKRGERVNVAESSIIAKTGALVLGQDQDSYIGGFNPRQTLKGNLASWNMWDKVLTAAEIADLASKCPTQEGNLVKWSQLTSQPLTGKVKMICTSFCLP